MNTTSTATQSYKVNVNCKGAFAGAVRVTVDSREDAPVAAVALMVEHAKAYNAKYAAGFVANGVAWATKSEAAADYSTAAVRKVATR